MNVETELKLSLSPASAGRVLQHPAIEHAARGPVASVEILSIYYDTPDFALRADGIALRLRRVGSAWVQTVKWEGGAAGGLHRRNELEVAVREQRLDLDAIDDPAMAVTLAPARLRARLRPIFVTEFRRSFRILSWGAGGNIEMSLDRGRIVAGNARAPICELELELRHGAPDMLFEVATLLAADVPLRPAIRSKAERGYALAGEAQASPARAAPIRLERDWTILASVSSIIASGLAQIEANEHGLLHAQDPEYLHQMRVAVRRLRSCLTTYASVLASEPFTALREELRWLGRRLGPAREWDVFLTELLPAMEADLKNEAGAHALGHAAQPLREAAYRSARAAVKSRRYARLVLGLGHVVAGGPWRAAGADAKQPVLPFAARMLQERLARVHDRGRGLKARSEQELHALRIAVKKLRYAVEFFGGLHPGGRTKTFRDRLVKLQDTLGTINDVSAIERFLEQLVPPSSPLRPPARDWSARIIGEGRKRLRGRWRAFRHGRAFW